VSSNNRLGSLAVFGGGVVSGLLLITALGVLTGFSLEATFESERGPFTYLHYLFIAGGMGGVLALGWWKNVRVATIGGVVLTVAIVASGSPGADEPLIRLTTELGGVAILVAAGVGIEYAGRHTGAMRSALTPDAVQTGLVFGVLHAVSFLLIRASLGFYEDGFIQSTFATASSLGVAIWTIGGGVVVGFVVGVLFRRYQLISPVLSVVLLLAAASIVTWNRVPARGPSEAVAAHVLTLYGWAWLGVLAVPVLLGAVEGRIRDYRKTHP